MEAQEHVWRERLLGPVRMLHLFIIQVMVCDAAMTHLQHIAGQAAMPGGNPAVESP